VFEAQLSPVGGTGPTFTIFTAETSTKIPDLSEYGLGLPKNLKYYWSHLAIVPATGVGIDEFASPTGVQAPFPDFDAALLVANRSFTTAP
jgi:hypothetical protein